MRVLLTGANGHIGANTARLLRQNGHEVVAFVRPTSDLRGLEGVNVTLAYGDVTDKSSLIAAAEGCEAIIHTAAIYRYWAKDLSVIETAAMEGTKNVFAAAQQAGVQRLVYTSSSWAIGLSQDPAHLRSAADWNDNPRNPYTKAKTFSERKAWELAEKTGIPMIALCPGAVLGPYDYRITPSHQDILMLANGTGQTFNVGFLLADVRDVAAIHAQAIVQGKPGERYPIGHNIEHIELGKLVSALTGKKVTHFNGSAAVVRFIAGLMELGAKFTGKEPALTRSFVNDIADRYMYIDCEPTWAAFNHTPFPVTETIKAAIDWLVQINALPSPGKGEARSTGALHPT